MSLSSILPQRPWLKRTSCSICRQQSSTPRRVRLVKSPYLVLSIHLHGCIRELFGVLAWTKSMYLILVVLHLLLTWKFSKLLEQWIAMWEQSLVGTLSELFLVMVCVSTSCYSGNWEFWFEFAFLERHREEWHRRLERGIQMVFKLDPVMLWYTVISLWIMWIHPHERCVYRFLVLGCQTSRLYRYDPLIVPLW